MNKLSNPRADTELLEDVEFVGTVWGVPTFSMTGELLIDGNDINAIISAAFDGMLPDMLQITVQRVKKVSPRLATEGAE